MNLPAFFIRNSLLVNLLCVLAVAAGVIALWQMNREAFPRVDFDIVIVNTVYPGAPPLEVEKLVTVPIEKELRQVSGIDEMTSVSRENVSAITIKIDPDARDKRKVVNDIQRAVDRVRDLPAEVEDDPVVVEITTEEHPVIIVSLSGPLSERDLQDQAEILEDRLLDLSGVASVQRQGWRDREVWVEVDPAKMQENHVSIEEIMEALDRKNINLPAGKTTQRLREFNIRTTAEFRTPEEIEQVIIRANDVGNWLRVRDVAAVKESFEDEETIAKTLGTRAIRLTVVKRGSADILKVVDDVKKTVEAFRSTAPKELTISFIDDLSYYVNRRLNVLKKNGIIGFSLVIVCLLVFLNRSVALWTASGIPIALLATFAAMSFLDITINLISMFGLVIVLGMLVDDGIIIAENIFRYMEEGMSPREAAVKGAQEVIGPVTATILTTVAAFLPLLFMSGIIGRFVSAIPKVVIIALFASLAEAAIVLPSHMADFVRRPSAGTRSTWDRPIFQLILGTYTRLLNTALNRRYLFASLFSLVLLLSLYLAFFVMNFILFNPKAIEIFLVRAEAPVGTALEVTKRLIEPVENLIAQLPPEELDTFATTVGVMREDENDPYGRSGSHLVQIAVYLTPPQQRRRTAEEIIADLREKSKGIKGFERLYFERVKPGPPTGRAIQVTIRGEDYDVLEKIADEFKAQLAGINGLTYMNPLARLLAKPFPERMKRLGEMRAAQDVVDDHEPGKGEVRVIVDENMAARAFLTPGVVARSVRNAFEGGIATSIKPTKAEEEIDVLVRFPEKYRNSMDAFENLLIPNSKGNLVPLRQVARVERLPGVSEIRHLDGKRALTLSGDVDEKVATSKLINSDLSRRFRDIPLRYPGYSLKYGGEEEETQRSIRNLLRAFLLALLLIFLILATQFRSLTQPVIVLLAIPFGLIGVVFGFLINNEPFGFMALLGSVGLAGVVVNDSIVLVDFINRLRVQGKTRRESLIEAGRLRLRPVILTTVTTVGGLMPLAYGIGGSDPFLAPAALAISWGLIFSTALTLLFIPCVYAILDDIVVHIIHRPTVSRYIRRIRNSLGEGRETACSPAGDRRPD